MHVNIESIDVLICEAGPAYIDPAELPYERLAVALILSAVRDLANGKDALMGETRELAALALDWLNGSDAPITIRDVCA